MHPFTLTANDGARLQAYSVPPAGVPRAIVQIAHGMAEHFRRYAHLAARLAGAGYAVFGADHRGHGGSADVHGLGDFGPGGFAQVVDDMATLTLYARAELPQAPVVLLGHSMGSFAAQTYVLDHADYLAGLVLSGTAAQDLLAAAMAARRGSAGLQSLNVTFEPARTAFDWLSRDEAEVDAYVADPLCGFELVPASLSSIFALGASARADPRLSVIRPDLPILVISGEVDPVVGPGQVFARALIESYEGAGLRRIEHRVYLGGRHEMFNETNRDEVEEDLIHWLERTVA